MTERRDFFNNLLEGRSFSCVIMASASKSGFSR
jgi:hypothetical protein